ncbi:MULTISPECIES: hypothetical protein [unclassified Ruegeria]|uniref:hypothetical protein n=1 Tax=unclassified Ruegeria TaxID=2625375 RepID=UPI001488FDF7|nr:MULTISPECIES: hypothetical protein [unclassified Ruegeria]
MKQRIIQMSKRLYWFTTGAVVIIPTLVVYAILSGEVPAFAMFSSDMPLSGTIALTLIAMLGLALLIWVLWILRTILKDCAGGAVLVPETAKNIQRLGKVVLALAAFQILDDTLIGLAESIGKAQGERSLVISIGSSDLLMLLCAGLVYLIGWIFAEAVLIDRENREFV